MGSNGNIRVALNLVAMTSGVGSIGSLIFALSSLASGMGNAAAASNTMGDAYRTQWLATQRLQRAQDLFGAAMAATGIKGQALTDALTQQQSAAMVLALAEQDLADINDIVAVSASGQAGAMTQVAYDELLANQATAELTAGLAAQNMALADAKVADAELAVQREEDALAAKAATAQYNLVLAQQNQEVADNAVLNAQAAAAQDALNATLTNYVAALAGAAIDAYAFDTLLKNIITDSGNLQYATAQMDFALHGTQSQIDALNPKIVQWADNSIYTTQQVTGLVAALSQHGLDVTDIMNGDAQSAINMAEAMGIQPVDSANLLASTLQMFSGQGYTAAQVSDILTASFYNGVPSATELQSALDAVGGTAQTLGITLPDLTANIDLLAQAGLPASQSGNSLRYVLQAISDPTTKAAADMNFLGLTVVNTTSPAFLQLEARLNASGKAGQTAVTSFDGTSVGLNTMFKAAQKLGLIPLNESFNTWATASGTMSSKLFDAKGNFIGLGKSISTILDSIKAKAHGNKQLELQLIEEMFNVRSGKAMSILAGVDGYGKHYNKLISQIGKTSASKDATHLTDTLNGSWAKLTTTFSSFMSTAGTPLLGWLTGFVKNLNGMVSSLMSANPVVMQFITIFIIVGAVLATLAVIIGLVAIAVLFLDGALLPLILIVLAVAVGIVILAAIIASIILLVQHWGQVTNWLGQQWKRFTDWLGGAVHAALTGVGNAFSALGTMLHAHITIMLNKIKSLWAEWKVWVESKIHQFVQNIVDKFQWLYDHNYYFQMLVDRIRQKFAEVQLLAHVIWQRIVTAITDKIHWMQGVINTVLTTLRDFIHTRFSQVHALADRVWKSIVKAITDQIHTLDTIGQWIHDHVIKPITDKFNSLITDATQWGQNFVKNLIAGIDSMAGQAAASAENIAKKLASYLGFHSPTKEGPGADADQWGPNLMRMYALGITNNTGLVSDAALNAAGAVRSGLTGAVGGGFPNAANAAGGGTSTANVYVGNEPLFQMVMNRLTGEMQINGLGRAWR